jgi:hypothetical protein
LPRYNKSKPYEGIPFQFSCHIWESPSSSKLKHFEYLHTDIDDPRPNLINEMVKGLGKLGSIVAYNMSFEKTVIKRLSLFSKTNANKLNSISERFVDPLPIIRSFVYHPDFKGSFSIKVVVPSLLNKLSYENLDIGDGSMAQGLANKMLKGLVTVEDKEKIIEDLLIYCRQDTLAMVELIKWLLKLE